MLRAGGFTWFFLPELKYCLTFNSWCILVWHTWSLVIFFCLKSKKYHKLILSATPNTAELGSTCIYLLGGKAERKLWGKNVWAHRAQTVHHNFLSSSGLQDVSLVLSHYLTLCPWYHACLQFKVTKKYFLSPKDKELWKSVLVWMGDMGCVVFSFVVPNLSRSHEKGVKIKVTAFEISGHPAHQHLHLASLCTWSGDLWPKHHLGGASLTTTWDNCVTQQE